jgi:UDP-glucose 4-epimerase
MHILVTGAHGFLAQAVIAELDAAGHHVATLTRRPPTSTTFPAYVTDLVDRDQTWRALDGSYFDVVCHLASLTKARESLERPLDYWDANVTGTLNLLRAINDDADLVLASTAAVYGSDAEGALDEDRPVRPGSPYAASKYAAEQIVAATAETRGVRSTVLRCFNIAGAVDGVTDSDTSRAIPALLRAAAGESDAFVINGDGTSLRDYTHVLDVARAFRLSTEHQGYGHHTYNVGTGTGVNLTQLVDSARDVTGRAIPVRHEPPKNEPQQLVADTSRISAELHWTPAQSSPHELIADAWNARTRTIRIS